MEEQLHLAEQRLVDLEKRILSVEAVESTASKENADDSALQAYQTIVLNKLKSIRSAMLSEVGDIDAVRSERDSAVAQNRKLEAELARQNYRIAHLIKALTEAQKR
ncbi:unnamed protein product [Ectocarpus fasciculatus]